MAYVSGEVIVSRGGGPVHFQTPDHAPAAMTWARTVVSAVRHNLGQRHGQGFPVPSFAQTSKPAIDRVLVAVFGWNVALRRAATEPSEYHVDGDRLCSGRWPRPRLAAASRSKHAIPLRLDRPAQFRLQKEALNQPLRASSSHRRARCEVHLFGKSLFLAQGNSPSVHSVDVHGSQIFWIVTI